MNHDLIERRIGLMGVLVAIVISIGGLVEIVPLYAEGIVTKPAPGVEPGSALVVAGRDVYRREGCYNCHSQMIRPLRAETERYGHYSVAGESVYDHPFQFGSKRTGPDLARVGGRYSDEWHRIHLNNARDVVPESNMPGYPWLADNTLDGADIAASMQALQRVGVPYTAEQIAAAPAEVAGKT
jgi:cytochrome c oxidase cbb3-type subunit 2